MYEWLSYSCREPHRPSRRKLEEKPLSKLKQTARLSVLGFLNKSPHFVELVSIFFPQEKELHSLFLLPH